MRGKMEFIENIFTGVPANFLIIAGIGVLILLVGLIKKLKFVIKLGLVIAVISFLTSGGLACLGI